MTQKPDESAVKKFYNETPEIWASYDRWHLWSRQQIQKYLDSVAFPSESDILNAGSGGNDYGIICKKMIHVDIADQKLKDIPNSVVANIESLPFQSNTFDGIVCVGSVINYCDAGAAISELSRTAKQGAILILEFESSAGFEYKHTEAYGQSAIVVTVKFQNEQNHIQWLYSPSYIKSLLKTYDFEIEHILPYHICSSFALYFCNNETKAVRFARFDNIARSIPNMASHANNFIFKCRKC